MEPDLILIQAYGAQNKYLDTLLKKGGRNYLTKE